MIKQIKAWFAGRAKRTKQEEFRRGFDYAAGMLLRGTAAEQLEIEADCCFDDTQFDDGIAAAIVKWEDHFPPEAPAFVPRELQYPQLVS